MIEKGLWLTTKTKGLLLAFLAYLFWGILSLYWKELEGIPSYTIFAYRILWTVLTMLTYMALSGQTPKYKRQLNLLWKEKSVFTRMILASLFITINWLAYIWAITHGQATQASLGYYIMPLVSIGLSVIFLKENLTRPSQKAMLLAVMGVLILIYQTGSLPFLTLLLSFSFAFYGLLKKGVALSSDVAMLFEAGVILPASLCYLIVFSQVSLLDLPLHDNLLLALSGVVTAIPLLLFSEAVKRAPLNQVGFLQYLNPTIQLFIAVMIFGENISPNELLGFALIWLAILVFVIGQLLVVKRAKKAFFQKR